MHPLAGKLVVSLAPVCAKAMSGDGADLGLVMPGPVSAQHKMLDLQIAAKPAAAAPQGPESMSLGLQALLNTCPKQRIDWLEI